MILTTMWIETAEQTFFCFFSHLTRRSIKMRIYVLWKQQNFYFLPSETLSKLPTKRPRNANSVNICLISFKLLFLSIWKLPFYEHAFQLPIAFTTLSSAIKKPQIYIPNGDNILWFSAPWCSREQEEDSHHKDMQLNYACLMSILYHCAHVSQLHSIKFHLQLEVCKQSKILWCHFPQA